MALSWRPPAAVSSSIGYTLCPHAAPSDSGLMISKMSSTDGLSPGSRSKQLSMRSAITYTAKHVVPYTLIPCNLGPEPLTASGSHRARHKAVNFYACGDARPHDSD